ncbi:MAG: glycoside hydrolase family 92 protein [Acidimicrobiales bacterium]
MSSRPRRTCGPTWPQRGEHGVDGSRTRRSDAVRRATSRHPCAVERRPRPDPRRRRLVRAAFDLCDRAYHSFVKPCFADDESPFWPADGPFVFDICTMWDIYKTQLPLLLLIAPERASTLLHALLQVSSEEGNLPIGYRMAWRRPILPAGQRARHTFFADALAAGIDDIDWEWALVHLTADLRRGYGEEYLDKGVAHPISHTLDPGVWLPLHGPSRPSPR